MSDTEHELKQQLNAVPIPPELRARSTAGILQARAELRDEKRQRRKRTSRRTRSVAAAAGLLLIAAMLLNHENVWASIQKALQFVPGIGVVEEDDAAASRYVLKQSITVSVGEGTVLVTGMQSDEGMTYVTMAGEHAPRFEYVTLINEQGEAFQVHRSMSSWGGSQWTASFWYKGKLGLRGNIKLRLPVEPAIEVPLRLEKAATYANYADLGETAAVNGLSITAVVRQEDGKARVSLVTPPRQDFRVDDYGLFGVYMHDESLKLQVADDNGRKLAVATIPAMSSPASDFYFPLSQGAGSYTLTLPEISATYADETEITISTEPKARMAQTFELAGYPVTITAIDKSPTDPNALRMYVDLHYDSHAAASLYKFDVKDLSSMTKLDERTGAMTFVEFGVEPGAKRMTIKLNRPAVVLRGPWTYTLRIP